MEQTKTHDFWRSAGLELVQRDERGWLKVTPEYLRAYLQRPELRPIDTSCPEEIRLHEDLLIAPFNMIREERLQGIADQDAADNYRIFLAFRDFLKENETVEAAYLHMSQNAMRNIPPLFMEQMAHLICRNMLEGCEDSLRLRAAEIFFREQSVNTDDGRIMLADEDVISLYEQNQRQDGELSLAELVQEASDLSGQKLDVLSRDNADSYWERSDRFDTVIDFRFTQPALDGFARSIENWIDHFLSMKVSVQPLQKVENLAGHWHIGMDAQSTEILSALYRGEQLSFETTNRIVSLLQMDVKDQDRIVPDYRGQPIYLGLAMSEAKRVKMKPQNLLVNLPLIPNS